MKSEDRYKVGTHGSHSAHLVFEMSLKTKTTFATALENEKQTNPTQTKLGHPGHYS